jgi:hypothetical protein
MTTEYTYQVPAFTTLELVSMRVALKRAICRFYKWRHDPVWRDHLRTHLTAYRKLESGRIV